MIVDHAGPGGPELYFALVTPIGVSNKQLFDALAAALSRFGYDVVLIRLSSYLDAALGQQTFTGAHEDDRVMHYIESGNQWCARLGRHDAVLGPALVAVQLRRADVGADGQPLPRTAFVFSSLKRPQEVERLRHIYGDSLFLIGADAKRERRKTSLLGDIQETRAGTDAAEEAAARLLDIDRKQVGEPFGQNVLHSYPLADLFVDMAADAEPARSLNRFVNLLFGAADDPLGTPTPPESAMAQAFVVSLESGSLSRRVGAVLVDEREGVVAVGTNEVPKPGGGHYSSADANDGRDIAIRTDYSRTHLSDTLLDLFSRLGDRYLASDVVARLASDPDELVGEALSGALAEAKLRDSVEFHRPVHAEAAALLDAARRGSPTQGLTLYSTTYPCHLCAKELVAAGIKRVVYIEPYPKSLAEAMYSDALTARNGGDVISLEPYVGVAPNRYSGIFRKRRSLKPIEVPPRQPPLNEATWSFDLVREREDMAISELNTQEQDVA
jgi:deoxycytidylate deaminase